MTRILRALQIFRVVQVIGDGQGTHVVDHVQLAGAIEVDDGSKRARMAVEEVFGPSTSAADVDAR